MHAKRHISRLGWILLIGLVLAAGALTARATGLFGPTIVEEQPGARRELQTRSETARPDISFIDNPSATCYVAARNTGQCNIQWNYLYVTASTSQYIISMTVEIDGRMRAYHSGFFQTYMYIPSDLYGDGFQVTCGKPDANGQGKTYAYTVRARESGGLSAANYGSVTCPGDVAMVYLPV
ncbi:MAG TPA: hypothetical protein VMP08_04920, partial [Anaerolineae bacterium]|nr:hypothetical protein [Anaerolineae bacterium]